MHHNSVALLDGGRVRGLYHKRRLLPFSETQPLGRRIALGARGDLDAGAYEPGTSPVLFELEGHQIAPLVCMEVLYPGLAREARELGATLIVNLSNDGWFRGRGGRRQHLAMARFRAVETGLPLVRVTSTGVSAVVAPDGRILAELGEDTKGVLRAEVPPPAPAPLYARVGDVFAIGCLCAVAAAPLLAVRRALRRQPAFQRLPVTR